MNSSGVAVVEELSEPELTQRADTSDLFFLFVFGGLNDKVHTKIEFN